jgi:hypothetical protein
MLRLQGEVRRSETRIRMTIGASTMSGEKWRQVNVGGAPMVSHTAFGVLQVRVFTLSRLQRSVCRPHIGQKLGFEGLGWVGLSTQVRQTDL